MKTLGVVDLFESLCIVKNWSRRAGLTVGGLPRQLVQGEEERVGGEGLALEISSGAQ